LLLRLLRWGRVRNRSGGRRMELLLRWRVELLLLLLLRWRVELLRRGRSCHVLRRQRRLNLGHRSRSADHRRWRRRGVNDGRRR
jgi:hypothetical protein